MLVFWFVLSGRMADTRAGAQLFPASFACSSGRVDVALEQSAGLVTDMPGASLKLDHN